MDTIQLHGRVDQDRDTRALLIRARGEAEMASRRVVAKQSPEEKKLPPDVLIKKAGPAVLRDPWLRVLVEAAETPKALDDMLLRLGWSTKLAARARNAARLKRDWPASWKDLREHVIRPGLSLMHYESLGDVLGPGFEYVDVSTDFVLGGESVDRSELPLFLREFRLRYSNVPVTTLDGRGRDSLGQVVGFEGKDDRDHWHWLFDHAGDFAGANGNGIKLSLYKSSGYVSTEFELGRDIRIRTKTILLEPNLVKHRPYPSLEKRIEITCRSGGNDGHGCLRLVVRQDRGPDFAKSGAGYDVIGYGSFQQAIMDQDFSEVRAAVQFVIRADGRLQIDRLYPTPIFVTFTEKLHQKQTDHDPPRLLYRQISRGRINYLMPYIAKLAHEIYRRFEEAPITLEDIAGISLVTNPPERLADLLTFEPVRVELIAS